MNDAMNIAIGDVDTSPENPNTVTVGATGGHRVRVLTLLGGQSSPGRTKPAS